MQEKEISIKDFLVKYKDILQKEIQMDSSLQITPENVFSEAVDSSKKLSEEFINSFMDNNSTIVGIDNLENLSHKAEKGHSCLVLLEHYSNADYPCFYFLLERMGYRDLASKLVAIAGVKLYEDSPVLKVLVKAFNSLFIYPSRSISKIKEGDLDEKSRSTKINMSSLRKLRELKKDNHIVAIFPSGTRYRPWDPSSNKVLSEIVSYLKQFEYCVFVGINGNILKVKDENMEEDLVVEDTVLFNVGSVMKTENFMEEALSSHSLEINDEQAKEVIRSAIEEELAKMHIEGEKIYLEKKSSN